MAVTLTVKPDKDLLGWSVFVNQRPVTVFNRDFQAFLNLEAGEHQLIVTARGAGAKIEVSIDGGARLTDPNQSWPFVLSVPRNHTGTDGKPATFVL